jgi:hypothetical protein
VFGKAYYHSHTAGAVSDKESNMSIVKNCEAYSSLKGNRNDCVVRALSIAANRPYEECDELFVKFGRKRNHRTDHNISKLVHAHLNSEVVSDHLKGQWPTLTQFIKANPKGRFVLTRNGHAFALVDGVVHDWSRGTGARSRIVKAWKVEKAN